MRDLCVVCLRNRKTENVGFSDDEQSAVLRTLFVGGLKSSVFFSPIVTTLLPDAHCSSSDLVQCVANSGQKKLLVLLLTYVAD